MLPFASYIMSSATYLWHHSVQSRRQWMNRPEFLWYVTEVLLFQLKIKWAGPLFLCVKKKKKNLSYTPTAAMWLPRENFCWCSRPLPPSPMRLSIHLHPSYSNSTCSFSSTAAVLRVQRSFCLGGEVTRPRLLSRVHSTSSLGHQHRGQMKGCSLGRRQNESRERRSFIRSLLFLFC